MLGASHTICMLAKESGSTIGGLIGTSINVTKIERTVNVVHFWFLGRKADYPSIEFMKQLEENKQKIHEKFPNADYLSLCVIAENNHLSEAYKKLGFSDVEHVEKGPFGLPADFHLMKISQITDLPKPTYAEVKKANAEDRLATVGYLPDPIGLVTDPQEKPK